VSVARQGERALIESGCAVLHQWPLGRWSLLSSRTRHLFAASGSQGAVAEDWVCVLCQSRNNSWWASGVWTPSHSGL